MDKGLKEELLSWFDLERRKYLVDFYGSDSHTSETLTVNNDWKKSSLEDMVVIFDMAGCKIPDIPSNLLSLTIEELAELDFELYNNIVQHGMNSKHVWPKEEIVNNLAPLAKMDHSKFEEVYSLTIKDGSPIIRKMVSDKIALLLPTHLESYQRLFRKGTNCGSEVRVGLASSLDDLMKVSVSDYQQFFSILIKDQSESVRIKTVQSLNQIALYSPTVYLDCFRVAISDESRNVQSVASSSLGLLLSPISLDKYICDKKSEFVRKYLDSIAIYNEDVDYVKQRLLTLLSYSNNIDFDIASGLLDTGINFPDIIECSGVRVPNYVIVGKLGEGAIKKAYLAKNIHSGDNSVFLAINPNSMGVNHYSQIYSGSTSEELVKRINEAEFSGVKLRYLKDTRHIGLVSPPIKGTVNGEIIYFLETTEFARTLEEELYGGISVDKAIKYFYQLSVALSNCHAAGVVHRDMKLDNIGISKTDDIVLSDFGGINVIFEQPQFRYQYPLNLRPPELAHSGDYWEDACFSNLFTTEANIWSLGAIAYHMFVGRPLFERPNPRSPVGSNEYHVQNKTIYTQINSIESRLNSIVAELGFVNIIAANAIGFCLRVNPEDRISAKELQSYLSNL